MTKHSPDDKKKQMLTVKILREKYLEFQAAAAVRGMPMSTLLTQFIFQTIRDVRKEAPEEFEQCLAELRGDPPPPTPTRLPSGRVIATPFIRTEKKGGK